LPVVKVVNVVNMFALYRGRLIIETSKTPWSRNNGCKPGNARLSVFGGQLWCRAELGAPHCWLRCFTRDLEHHA